MAPHSREFHVGLLSICCWVMGTTWPALLIARVMTSGGGFGHHRHARAASSASKNLMLDDDAAYMPMPHCVSVSVWPPASVPKQFSKYRNGGADGGGGTGGGLGGGLGGREGGGGEAGGSAGGAGGAHRMLVAGEFCAVQPSVVGFQLHSENSPKLGRHIHCGQGTGAR